MKFTIEFESGDAALSDDPHGESARILRAIASRLDDGEDSGIVADLNGNSVGQWWMSIPDENLDDLLDEAHRNGSFED